MSVVIPQGTTVAAERTLRVFVADATTFAAKTTGVAGETAELAFGAADFSASDNVLVATTVPGWYTLELSDDETGNDPCTAHIAIAISGCASAGQSFQIGPSTTLAPTPTAAGLAAANRDSAIQMLLDGMTFGASSMTVKDSNGDEVTITITRVARDAIASTAAP